MLVYGRGEGGGGGARLLLRRERSSVLKQAVKENTSSLHAIEMLGEYFWAYLNSTTEFTQQIVISL